MGLRPSSEGMVNNPEDVDACVIDDYGKYEYVEGADTAGGIDWGFSGMTVLDVEMAYMQLYRNDVIGVRGIGDVLEQWERPAHNWGGKTAWRLFNAATFALAGKVAEKPDLTKQLHHTIDGVCEHVH